MFFSPLIPMRICLLLLSLLLASGLADEAEFQALRKTYGNLVTIVGTGLSEDANDWKPGFEGAKGTSVELSNPHMCMADAAGNFYIADKESHSILKVTPEGIVTTFAGTHEPVATVESGLATKVPLNNPNGLYVFPNGTVFVLDFGNNRLRKVTPDGQLTTVFQEPEGFGPGRALWVSRDERTVYYASSGSLKRWTNPGGSRVITAGIIDPGNLDVDPISGQVAITDRGANLVYRVDDAGTKTIIAGNGLAADGTSGVKATDCALEEVRGIAFLPNGAYFLATMKGGDIWYVDTQGIIHEFLSGRGKGNVYAGEGEPVTTPGEKISEPRSVTIAPNGDIVITCNDTGYLRVVKKVQPKAPKPTPQIRLDGKQSLRLLWNAEAGQISRLEHSPDLRAWRTLKEFPANSKAEALEFVDATSNGSSKYYRVAFLD